MILEVELEELYHLNKNINYEKTNTKK